MSFGNFATAQINRYKDNFYFLKRTLTKIIMPIFINKNNIYLLQNKTNQKILGFRNTMLILS